MELSGSYTYRQLCHLWIWWVALWHGSALYAGYERLARALDRSWQESTLRRLVYWRGPLYCAWPHSLCCRLCTWLLNLIPRLLHWIYCRWQHTFDASRCCRALFALGDGCVAALSWLMVVLLIVPQPVWNNLYSLVLALLCLGLFLLSSMRRRHRRLDLSVMGPYPVLFAVLTVVFAVYTVYPSSSLRFFVFHFTCGVAVLTTVSAVETREDLRRLVFFIAAGIALSCLYGLVQRAMGIEVSSRLVDLTHSASTPGRVFSVFENSNSFACVLLMFIPVLVGAAIWDRPAARLVLLGISLLGGLCLLLTYSRGGWVGFAVSIVVLTLLLRPRLIPLYLVAGLALLPLLPDSIRQRLFSIFGGQDSSISSRKYLFEGAWGLIRQRPLQGVGLGYEAVAEAVYYFETYRAQALFIHTHNIYLEVAAEMGVFGFLAFAGTMISALKNGICAVSRRLGDRYVRGVTAGCVGGLAGVLVYSLADYPWSYPRVMLLFWLLFALLTAAVKVGWRQDGKCSAENREGLE